jgi:hypothetical protein
MKLRMYIRSECLLRKEPDSVETADAEWDRLISKRASQDRRPDPDGREELWQESVRRYNARRRDEMTSLVPAAAPGNTGEPQKAVAVWANVTTQNFGGGPARGNLEGTLRYLASLGAAAEVGEELGA